MMKKNNNVSVRSGSDQGATAPTESMRGEIAGVVGDLPPVTLRLSQSEGSACLALEDKMAPPSLVLEVINNGARPIIMRGGSPWILTVEFRHGVLSQSSLDMLRGDQLFHNLIGPEWSNRDFHIELLVPDDPGVAVKLSIRRSYVSLDPIAPGQSFKLPLYGLSAAPQAGPRLTRVRLTHDMLKLEGDNQKIAGDTIQLLQIMTREYPRPDPLQAYFVSGTALDPDRPLNAVVLAVAFRDGRPFNAHHAAGPHFCLTVQVGDAPSALCTADDIRTIRVYEKFEASSQALKSSKAFKLDPNCPTLAHADITLDSAGQDFGSVFYIGIAEIPAKSRSTGAPELGGHLGPGESHWDYPVPITLEYANIEGAPRGVIDVSLTRFPAERSFAQLDARLRALEKAQKDGPVSTPPVQPKGPAKPKEPAKPEDRGPVRHYLKLPDTRAWEPSKGENDEDIPPLFSTIDGVPGPYFEVSAPRQAGSAGYYAPIRFDGVMLVHRPSRRTKRRYNAPGSLQFGIDLTETQMSQVHGRVKTLITPFSPEMLEGTTLERLKLTGGTGTELRMQIALDNGLLYFDHTDFQKEFWRIEQMTRGRLFIFFEILSMTLDHIKNPEKLYRNAD